MPEKNKEKSLNKRIAELAILVAEGDVGSGNLIVQLLDTPIRIRLRKKVPLARMDDVYQETWVRFFKQLKEGMKPDNYIAWFLGIAYRVEKEMFREDIRAAPLEDEVAAMLESNLPTLDHHAYAAQINRALMSCLEKIPSRYSEFLKGHASNELRPVLCDRLDVLIKNYYSFLHRARSRLSKCMNNTLEGGKT